MTKQIPTWSDALLNVDPQAPNIHELKQNAIAQEIDELRTRLAEVEKDADVMHQAITDQENQPSQFGTVTLAMYQRLETKLAYADNVIEQRNAMLHAQWEQKPFAWYDPSADKFTRDLDDPSMNRGATLWRLFLDAGVKP